MVLDGKEKDLIAAIKYFQQNVLVTGEEHTGKTTTVCLGVAAHYIASYNNDGILEQDPRLNYGFQSEPSGFNNAIDQRNPRTFAMIMAFKTPTSTTCR
uniref:AAA_5 domain-containing protein n=1 Tax=Strongyloides venezuelensis TaxID=75913 RepID=A0A0K0FPD3_STRVS